MKKTFLVLFSLVLVFVIGSNAEALSVFNFSGSSNGGTGSATMGIEIVGNTLTATVNNISPVDLDGGSNGGNSPGITGFGFDLDPNSLGLVSWTLTAYTDANNTNSVTIGADTGGYDWNMGAGIGGISLDYLPNTGSIDGALYNPDAFSDPNNTLPGGQNSVYYTTAVLTMEFNQAPILNTLNQWSPFVRMQNVGLRGEGSLKLPGTPTNPIPEPTTILLVGLGLLGIAGFRKKLGK